MMLTLTLSLCLLVAAVVTGASPDECPETCATIPNSFCDSVNACGYITVRSRAGYVGKFCLNGEDEEDKKDPKQFCCSSGNFLSGVSRTLKLPCLSDQLVVIVEDEVTVNNWSTVGVIKPSNSSVDLCYEIAGTTTKPTIQQVNCTSTMGDKVITS